MVHLPILGKEKRTISVKEAARLQSFPDTFQYDAKNAQAYKQFGNSINVALVKLFARYMFGDKEVQHLYSKEVQFPPDKRQLELDLFNDN